MTSLLSLTILEQVRLVTPMLLIAIAFALLTWLMCYVTEVRVNRKWLRDPANMERTVQDQLARKDDVIRNLESQRDELLEDNVRLAAILRGVRSRVIGG